MADPSIKSASYFDFNLSCFHRSCYSSAPVGISTCVSQVLTGRKKRAESENISEESINAFNEEGEPIDFSHLISPSKVSLQSKQDWLRLVLVVSIGKFSFSKIFLFHLRKLLKTSAVIN